MRWSGLGRWLAAATVGLGFAGQARAETWFVVAVGRCNEVSSGEPARALRDALAQRAGLGVMTEEGTAKALGGSVSASMDEVERRYTVARDRFVSGEFTSADRELVETRKLLVLLPPSEERWNIYREVVTYHAMVKTRLERRAEAETDLRSLLALEPDYAPTPAKFPPTVRKLTDSLRAPSRREKKVELTVNTEPSTLPIYVGLKPVGTGKVTLKLPPGEYMTEADFGSARGLPRKVTLNESAQITLTSAFEGGVWPDRGPCVEAGQDRTARLAYLTRIANVTQATKAVSVHMEQGSGERFLVVSLVEAKNGEELRTGRVKLGAQTTEQVAVAQLADFLTTGNAASAVQVMADREKPVNLAPVAAPTPAKSATIDAAQPAPSGNSGLRVASYVAGGVGVVGLGVGVVGLLQKSSADSDYNKYRDAARNGDTDAIAKASDAEKRSKSGASLATIGFVGGGAALASGVVMYFVSRPSSVQPAVGVMDGKPSLSVAGEF